MTTKPVLSPEDVAAMQRAYEVSGYTHVPFGDKLLASHEELRRQRDQLRDIKDESPAFQRLTEANAELQHLLGQREHVEYQLAQSQRGNQRLADENKKLKAEVEWARNLVTELMERIVDLRGALQSSVDDYNLLRQQNARLVEALQGVEESIVVARQVLPAGSVARGSFEGAFVGVTDQLRAALKDAAPESTESTKEGEAKP